MAQGVRVHISNAQLKAATVGSTGVLTDWAHGVADDFIAQFHRRVEDNLESNAMHRGGVVGGYRAGIGADVNQNQYGLQIRGTNSAAHAAYAEFGRGPSQKWQYFSWSKKGGRGAWYSSTRGRDGQHAMRSAMNATMPRYVDGYTPLS